MTQFAQVRKAAGAAAVAGVTAALTALQADQFNFHAVTGTQVGLVYGAIVTGWCAVYHLVNAPTVQPAPQDALAAWADTVVAAPTAGDAPNA